MFDNSAPCSHFHNKIRNDPSCGYPCNVWRIRPKLHMHNPPCAPTHGKSSNFWRMRHSRNIRNWLYSVRLHGETAFRGRAREPAQEMAATSPFLFHRPTDPNRRNAKNLCRKFLAAIQGERMRVFPARFSFPAFYTGAIRSSTRSAVQSDTRGTTSAAAPLSFHRTRNRRERLRISFCNFDTLYLRPPSWRAISPSRASGAPGTIFPQARRGMHPKQNREISALRRTL